MARASGFYTDKKDRKRPLTRKKTLRPDSRQENDSRRDLLKQTQQSGFKAYDFLKIYPSMSAEFGERIKQHLSGRMKSLIEKTESDGLEHGFVIYKDGTISTDLVGKSNHMLIDPKDHAKRIIGLFHTHPEADKKYERQYFSVGDLRAMLSNNLLFQCLGYQRDGQYVVKCASFPYGKNELVKQYEEAFDRIAKLDGPGYFKAVVKETNALFAIGEELTDQYVFTVGN